MLNMKRTVFLHHGLKERSKYICLNNENIKSLSFTFSCVSVADSEQRLEHHVHAGHGVMCSAVISCQLLIGLWVLVSRRPITAHSLNKVVPLNTTPPHWSLLSYTTTHALLLAITSTTPASTFLHQVQNGLGKWCDIVCPTSTHLGHLEPWGVVVWYLESAAMPKLCQHQVPGRPVYLYSRFLTWTPENVRTIGSGLSLEFAFHTQTTGAGDSQLRRVPNNIEISAGFR